MSVASAIRLRDPTVLPGRRDEDWRWTDLKGLLRVMPRPSPAATGAACNPLLDAAPGGVMLFVNGAPVDEAPLEDRGGERLVRRFVSTADGTAHHVEADLEVAAGERLLLIDSFEGQAAGYLASAAGTIRVAEGAVVERIVLTDDAADAVSVCRFEVVLAPGARFSQTVLASGAKRQRVETLARGLRGADVRLDGLFVLYGARHADQTTDVRHDGPTGVSVQLIKGMAADQARSVFQGRIRVAPGADGTDARLASHAILLSDAAEADAKPELEIYADDVKCAHGATVGALDEAAVFYARSRGIPEPQARAMLSHAFLADVADRIEDPLGQALAQAWIERALGRMT